MYWCFPIVPVVQCTYMYTYMYHVGLIIRIIMYIMNNS